MAIKFSEDKYYKNDYYAKVGGIKTNEMNNLEKEFLFLINFDLYVDSMTFEKYHLKLLNPEDSRRR